MRIIVGTNKIITEKTALKLQKMGLLKGAPNLFVGSIDDYERVKKIRRFCGKRRLKFAIDNEYGSRSKDYRRNFLENIESRNGKYRCVYCGRKLAKDKIVIDHLYPISKVSKSIKLQEKLKKQGVLSVNDLNNLVPACSSCNRAKSDKMGFWIIRGKLGKLNWLWKVRWIIRILFLLIAILCILSLIFPKILNFFHF